MNNIPELMMALLTGSILGAIFFGGLWWTVRRTLTSSHPALWMLSSLMLRTGLTLTGFYFVSDGDPIKLLVCLMGFLVARIVVLNVTQPVMSDDEACVNTSGRLLLKSGPQESQHAS